MSYHRGGHAGAVAVSYSTGPMAALSPMRYSSGSTGTSSSGVGSSTAKLSSYRSSASSAFERSGSYYSSSSGSSSSYVATHRSPLPSEYRRYCSPSRSVSSSAYSDTGAGRYSSSRDRSESRESLGSLATSAADIIAKYSPAHYVPNIYGSSQHSSSVSTSIFGGNAADAKTVRDEDAVDSGPFPGSLGRPPRATRRPPLSTLLTSHHAQSMDSAATAEVTRDDRNNNNNNNTRTELLPVKTYGPAAGVSPAPKRSLPTNASNNELTNNNEREELRPAPASPQETEGSRHGDAPPSLDSSSGTTVVQNGVTGRPNGIHGGDLPAPSTSRRGDSLPGASGPGNANLGASSPSTSTLHQSIYRSISEQTEGSPTARTARNRLQAPRDERCGLNGLRNIGNTCFMNSVIQCLSNTRPLLEYLLNEQYLADINTSTSGMKGALMKAFSQVIQELWEVGGDHVVNTSSLKSQIQRFAPRFMGYSQQDAQEFLRYLLEGLHEDVNRVTVKPQPIHTDIPDHYTDSQKAAESWKRYLRSEDSTIVDVFVGQLRSSLHCTSCGHVSVTLDPFWDLSLPIPTRSGTVKMSQCLEHFTKEEVLDGDEKPTCSKCQMRRKCTKSFSIQKFPKILVIHLKRFSPMERFRGKLSTLVDFPLTSLDLSAFAAPRVQGCTYNLYGVANHSGTTYSGHYTAYCKHPYSGEWHEYNDSRVSSVPARSVVSSEAYVLFYEQQPHSSHL